MSKPINVGNLTRSAHAFGASFVFTVSASCDLTDSPADTSNMAAQVPVYPFSSLESMRLPREGCALVR